MNKTRMGPRTLLYPMPVVLVGAKVDDKPNFMTAAWCGIVNSEPPMISVAIRPKRYTLKGIQQNKVFSINIPSANMAKEADYCGLVSGSRVDKVETCHFKLFYGNLPNAPLIKQCPVNLECEVVHELDLGSHVLVIGRIEESYVSANCLSNDLPDVEKIKPIIFTSTPQMLYHAFGKVIADAYSAGKELIPDK